MFVCMMHVDLHKNHVNGMATKPQGICLLCILGKVVGWQLPVILLHAVHDVKLIIAYVVALLVLATSLQGKGYYRQPLAPTNQYKVP